MAGGGKVEQLELAFMLNAKSVEQASKALQTEIEKGLGAVSFDAMRRNADVASKQIGETLKKALTQELTVDTSKLDRQLADYHSKRIKIEQQVATEVAKSSSSAAKQDDKQGKSRLSAIRNIFKQEKMLLTERKKAWAAVNNMAKKHLGLLNKMGGKSGGPGAVGGKGKAKGGKKGGFLGKLAGGGKAMAGMGKAAGMLGKVGALLGPVVGMLGAVVAGLGAAAAAIGAVVGVIMGIVAVIMAADSKMKEFNKSLLSTVGGADMLGQGFDSATDSIDAMRDAAINMQFSLRSLAKDNIEVIKTLHEHGSTIREMTNDMTSAKSALTGYGQAMSLVINTSRMIGESASTVAQNMATQSEELGLTLETVAEKFSTIGRFAMESGFSTKRFFSMVIQATSGMSMYNVRLEEASALLVRIGKILGQKTGGEFLSTLSKGFVDESMTARFKRVKLAGVGRTKATVTRSAENTADAFVKDLAKNKKFGDITMGSIGLAGGDKTLGTMDKKELVKVLKDLSPTQQKKMLAKFHMEATKRDAAAADGMRNRLTVLANISEASKGGLTNMAKNLDQLDMGGKLNMLRDSMKGMFPGKEIHELSALQLAALESATGMQGEQLRQMRNLTQAFDGNYEVMKDMAKEVEKNGYTVEKDGVKRDMTAKEISASQRAQVKAYGAVVGMNGKMLAATLDSKGNVQITKDANGVERVVGSIEDYYQSQGARVEHQTQVANFSEDKELSREIADNTFSIADALNAGITMVLNQIFKVVQGILTSIVGDNSFKSTLEAQSRYSKVATKTNRDIQILSREIRKKEKAAAQEKDFNKAQTMKQEVEEMKDKRETMNIKYQGAKYAANNAFNADGTPNMNANLGTGASGFISRTQGSYASYGDGGLPRGMLKEAQANPEFMDMLKQAAPRRFARQEGWKTEAEQMGYTEEQIATSKAARVTTGRNIHNANLVTQSINADQDMTAFTIKDPDRAGGFSSPDNPMSGDAVHGSFHTQDVHGIDVPGHGAITNKQRQDAWKEDAPEVVTGRMLHDFKDPNRSRKEAGTTWTGASDAPSNISGVSITGEGSTYKHRGIGVSSENLRNTDTRRTLRIRGRDDEVTSHGQALSGGVAGTFRTHQPQAITSIGQTTTHLAPSDASYATFNSDAAGNATNRSAEDINAEMAEMAIWMQGLGLNLEKVTDSIAVTYSPGVTDGKLDRRGQSTTGYVTAEQSKKDKDGKTADARGSGYAQANLSNDMNTSFRGAEGGGDIIHMFKLLEKQVAAGYAGQKEDGDDYTTEDLKKDFVKATLEVGADKMSQKKFEDWMAANQRGPWDNIKKSKDEQEKVRKYARNAEKVRKEIKKLLAEGKTEEAEAKKSELSRNAATFLGLDPTGDAAKNLAKGEAGSLNTPDSPASMYKRLDNDDPRKALLLKDFKSLGVDMNTLQDFIYQGGSQGGVIRPINTKDEFIGMKPGGAVDQATGGVGGGGSVFVYVCQEMDLEKVKQAVYAGARMTGPGGSKKAWAGKGNFGHPMKKFKA